MPNAPNGKYGNALRWYNHIASYTAAESKKFPGTKKAASAYGPAGKTPVAARPSSAKPAPKKEVEEDDDDDIDLFGSDEEEDAENERLKAQRVAEYNKKKAASKYRILLQSVMMKPAFVSDVMSLMINPRLPI